MNHRGLWQMVSAAVVLATPFDKPAAAIQQRGIPRLLGMLGALLAIPLTGIGCAIIEAFLSNRHRDANLPAGGLISSG